MLRYGVNIEPDSDAVAYWGIILGTFMASLDLRAFPFDAQRLHVQMEIPGWAGGNVRLQPSSGGTRMFNSNPGTRRPSRCRVALGVTSSFVSVSAEQQSVPSKWPIQPRAGSAGALRVHP